MLETPESRDKDVNICFESYPQSWYPICLSKSLTHSKVLVQKAFGRDWILFRDKSSNVGMLSRHCSHMGTDLVSAKIVNGALQCPLHHWLYDTQGQCNYSQGNRFERGFSSYLHTRERYGVIFAFWGKEPLFELPNFNNLAKPLTSNPSILVCDMPLIMMGINGYDTVHFDTIHHRPLQESPKIYSDEKYHLAINYNAIVKPVSFYDKLILIADKKTLTIQLDCWGGNYFLVNNVGTDFYAMAAGLPVDSKKTHIYIIGAVPESQSFLKRIILDKIKTYFSGLLAVDFLKPDMKVLNNIAPDFNHPFIRNDAVLNSFINYWKHLPALRGN
jgi:phenylpropionate dioxygenase-like ring-hydroxylating dioxygenase large terminal subunit